MYIRKSLSFSHILIHPSIEFLLISLNLKPGNLLCGLFYRPPSSPLVVVTLESALESLPPAKLNSLILLGDFNIDFLSPSDSLHYQIQSISDKLSLRQVITAPTRVTPTTSTVIDHVYLSENLGLSSCNILPPLTGSDHNSVVVSLQLSPPYQKATRIQKCRL